MVAGVDAGPQPVSSAARPAGVARVAVTYVTDGSDSMDVVRDASIGFPALSEDGLHVAFVFDDAYIASFSNRSFQIVSTRTAKIEKTIRLVEPDWIERELPNLSSMVDARVREANALLAGYAPMPSATAKYGQTKLTVAGHEATFEHGRFVVTRAGRAVADVDGSAWTAKPIDLGGAMCTFTPFPSLVAIDVGRKLVVVVVDQEGHGGGDACAAPRHFRMVRF